MYIDHKPQVSSTNRRDGIVRTQGLSFYTNWEWFSEHVSVVRYMFKERDRILMFFLCCDFFVSLVHEGSVKYGLNVVRIE